MNRLLDNMINKVDILKISIEIVDNLIENGELQIKNSFGFGGDYVIKKGRLSNNSLFERKNDLIIERNKLLVKIDNMTKYEKIAKN